MDQPVTIRTDVHSDCSTLLAGVTWCTAPPGVYVDEVQRLVEDQLLLAERVSTR